MIKNSPCTGGKPSYLSLQRHDIDRANEKAILLGLSYNTDFFSSLGLSSYINIARGVDAKLPLTGADLPDRNEYDITVDYKPPEGLLEGLWLRARAAFLDIEGDGENWTSGEGLPLYNKLQHSVTLGLFTSGIVRQDYFR